LFASRLQIGAGEAGSKEIGFMNRNRLIIGFAFALLLAFGASAFVYHAFRQASAAPAVIAMQHIVVAAEPLPLGTLLDASKLKTIPWSSSEPVTGMFTKIEDCASRALITSVAENEPILEAKLAPRESGAGLPATIPAGMRALSVAVNDVIGVAGFVTPGTTVDVLVTGVVPGTTQGTPSTVTRTILENVRVLAAGQKIQQDRDGKPETVPVITLLVAPEDAGKLAMASTQGKIQLALRNTVDVKATNPAPVLESALFASGAAPVPEHVAAAPRKVIATPPPPAVLFTVEVISGGKRETKSFPNQ
jgi:pilus assembly protein CpaB